jgi:hypothetical protein
LPPRTPPAALPSSILGDPVTDPVELAELFDVEVKQFAGTFALIAPHRLSRFQSAHPVQSEPPQDAADG